MRRRSRQLSACLAGLLSVMGVASCGGGGSTTTSASTSASAVAITTTATTTAAPTPAPTPTPPPTPTPAPTPPPLAAPLIVQIENAPDARPQSGLGEADVVYEYETEGGISRFSTIFFAPPSVQLGPVRSARIATVKLTKIWDGSLIYSGSVPYILGLLQQAGVRFKTEVPGGPLFRINSRVAPHNLYTDGPHLSSLIQQVAPPPTNYQLWGRTPVTALPAGGTAGLSATVQISNFEQPHFTYDGAAGGYTRTEPTGQLRDAATGKPWAVPTIVVLQVPVSVGPEVEDVSGTHGLDFGVVGSGPAQVLVGGWSFTGTFTQGESGPPVLKMADGAPMPIAPGQVLIILQRQGNAVRTS
jgi:hypothetical protein